MATIETTRQAQQPILPTTGKIGAPNRLRSKGALNRFLEKNKGYEFVDGKLERKKMPNAKHSGIAGRLTTELGFFLKNKKIGRVYPEAHFTIGQNKRIPDVAFVSAKRIPKTGEPNELWEIAPDVAIEIVSPSDIYTKIMKKIREYFGAGVKQVWLIDAEHETVTIYFSPVETRILTKADVMTCKDILPAFNLPLNDIFID